MGAEILDVFENTIDSRLKELSKNPYLAPPLRGSKIFRKLLIHKNVSVFYSSEIDYIKILLVWDNRQDPKELHKKLIDSYKSL